MTISALAVPRGGADRKTSLAGNLFPFLSRFALSTSDVANIREELSKALDFNEFALIAVLAFGLSPCFEFVYKTIEDLKKRSVDKSPKLDFEDTSAYRMVDSVSQLASVCFFLYIADCIAIVLNSMGFKYLQRVGYAHKAATMALIAWFARQLMHYKRVAIFRTYPKPKPRQLGRVKLYNSLLDTLIAIVAGVVLVDRLNVDFGITLKSLFAFGGMGTIVLSLASQGIATQLVNGLAVSASELFFPGDFVQFGDGTRGYIHHVGLLYTEVRGSDEIIAKIPNTQIANQRTSNISRLEKCRVKQTLRFRYEDIEKLPAVMESIRQEIAKSCPRLISDGSRPYNAHWTEYKDDHVEAVVDCHFNLSPKGKPYWDLRQAVLLAIARAVSNHGIQFARPNAAYTYYK